MEGSIEVVCGPVHKVVRVPGPEWGSADRGSVFSGHPLVKATKTFPQRMTYAFAFFVACKTMGKQMHDPSDC